MLHSQVNILFLQSCLIIQKINLCDQIPEVFLHTRIPVIFVVDSFSVLQDNTDWVNKRSDLLDGVMDKEGTTKFLKDIVSEQSPSAIII